MRNLRTAKMVYWVNVSESSGTTQLVVLDSGSLNGCCCLVASQIMLNFLNLLKS